MQGYSVIDGNSIGYAAQATRVLKADGIETQAIYQTLKMTKALKQSKSTYGKFIFLWDGSGQFRKDLFPEYKENRDQNKEMAEMREKYKQVRPLISEALTLLGITQIVAPDYEADDVAAYLSRQIVKAGKHNVLLITGDRDWQQLVNSKVSWYDPRKQPGKYCTRGNFKEVTEVDTPAQFLDLKAIQGDSSDNISGVGGLGPNAAIGIINNYGSVRGLVKHFRENGEFTKENIPDDLKRFRKKLNEFCSKNLKLYTRNYRLMNLITDERDESIKQNMIITKGKKDLKAFKEFCHNYRFLSIVREMDIWDSTF